MSTPSPSPDAGRVRFRKLRIAFSAVCLIACVLLIVLWVRSRWWNDEFSVVLSKDTAGVPRMLYLDSWAGVVSFHFRPHVNPGTHLWSVSSRYAPYDVSNVQPEWSFLH